MRRSYHSAPAAIQVVIGLNAQLQDYSDTVRQEGKLQMTKQEEEEEREQTRRERKQNGRGLCMSKVRADAP